MKNKIAACLALALSLSTSVLAQSTPPKAEAPKSDAAKSEPSGIDKVGDTAERIVEKPLKDLNLSKEKIPPEIQAVMDRPYDISKLKSCTDLRKAVGRLTEVLGPDIDSPQATKKGENPAEFALGAAESVAGSLIPGTGLIRKISGAEANDRKVKAAILAGQLRRAYIKGAAKARGCKV